ncbi:hypothetical protein FQA39_LY11211 [Lamprigera yunnana]|nr:hypothetical protein FQA39_LY11211 [Lamprigera yunnana]
MENRNERIDQYQKDMQLGAEHLKLHTTVEHQEKRLERLEKKIQKKKMINYGIKDIEEQSDVELKERIRHPKGCTGHNQYGNGELVMWNKKSEIVAMRKT